MGRALAHLRSGREVRGGRAPQAQAQVGQEVTPELGVLQRQLVEEQGGKLKVYSRKKTYGFICQPLTVAGSGTFPDPIVHYLVKNGQLAKVLFNLLKWKWLMFEIKSYNHKN